MANAIAGGDWAQLMADAEALFADNNDDNRPQVTRLQGVTWSGDTMVNIFAGTNDFSASVPLGAVDSLDTSTFRGAINHVIETLLTAYPQLRVSLVTPMVRTKLGGGPVDVEATPNSGGIYLRDYRDAVLDQAARYNIPAYDLYRNCGVNSLTAGALLQDGVHPSAAGRSMLSRQIAGFLTAQAG